MTDTSVDGFQIGDVIRTVDSNRRGRIASLVGSLHMAKLQWMDGSESWYSVTLLERVWKRGNQA